MSLVSMRFEEILVAPETPIIEAIRIIDKGSVQIALVAKEGNILVGTVTDGDVRRGILAGIALDEPVSRIMNAKPTVARANQSHREILKQMRSTEVLQIPVVNEVGKLVGVRFLKDLVAEVQFQTRVVLMAGGLGKRLSPLTDDCPKPMLKVGDKPILEHIVRGFIDCGFNRFSMILHYRGEMIVDYFGDGARFGEGVEIDYFHEEAPLGTAGALALVKERLDESFFVMNADLLTKINFRQLLHFHQEQAAAATMCVHKQSTQIPFGVVNLDGHIIRGIEEKPITEYFVNAGVYVMEPEVLEHIGRHENLDMPDLFNRLIASKSKTAAFPVREEWLDVGRMEDFKRAQSLYVKN